MRSIKQIIRDLLTLHNGLFGIGQFHCRTLPERFAIVLSDLRLSLRCPTVETIYRKRLTVHEPNNCSGGVSPAILAIAPACFTQGLLTVYSPWRATRPYSASRILGTTQIRRRTAFSCATDVTIQHFHGAP